MTRTPNSSTQKTLGQYLLGNLRSLGENILTDFGELTKTPWKKNDTPSRWRILVLRSHDQPHRKRANKIISFCRLVTSSRAFFGTWWEVRDKVWKRMAGVLHEMGRLYSSNCKCMGRGVEEKRNGKLSYVARTTK